MFTEHENKCVLAPAASLHPGVRPIYKDDTPLRPPANLVAIQQQREMKVIGVPPPRPRSRGQDQPIANFARNNAFIPRVSIKPAARLPALKMPAAHREVDDSGMIGHIGLEDILMLMLELIIQICLSSLYESGT